MSSKVDKELLNYKNKLFHSSSRLKAFLPFKRNDKKLILSYQLFKWKNKLFPIYILTKSELCHFERRKLLLFSAYILNRREVRHFQKRKIRLFPIYILTRGNKGIIKSTLWIVWIYMWDHKSWNLKISIASLPFWKKCKNSALWPIYLPYRFIYMNSSKYVFVIRIGISKQIHP